MFRSALTLCALLPTLAFANEVFESTDPSYVVLGDNGTQNIQLYTDVGITKKHSNGAFTLADAPDLTVAIPEGYQTAELVGVYVKPCDSSPWINSEGTRYEIKHSYTNIVEGVSYNLDVTPYSTYLINGAWKAYDCVPATPDPAITGEYREVTFGYLVKFTTSACAADAYVNRIAWEYPHDQNMWYKTGDIVVNAGAAYECLVGGWCTTGESYTPGEGLYWDQAWEQIEVCN